MSCKLNSAAMYIRVQASFQITVFSRYMSRSGITRSQRLFSVFQGTSTVLCFPGGSDGKESTCNVGDLGSVPGLGRPPGEGKGYPLQYSGLENSMDCLSTWGPKELDTTESFHFISYCSLLPWWFRR